MNRIFTLRGGLVPLPLLIVSIFAPPSLRAEEPVVDAETLKKLVQKVEGLEQKMEEKDRKIGSLEQRVRELQERQKPTPAQQRDALTEAMEQLERDKARSAGDLPPAMLKAPIGSNAALRLIDISLDVLLNAGSSTEPADEILNLQGGGHDPKARGFTLGQAELSLQGAVDPYLNAEAHIIFLVDPGSGETETELEEAFATTQTLPLGLQLKAGHFFSKFGLINPTHPHAWDWIDQPVINGRVFGGDGMRQSGAQLSWLTPLPWFSEVYFGAQNATGETMTSFLSAGEAVGGRPFVDSGVRSAGDLNYLVRWFNFWDLSDDWSLGVGGSGVYGPNATGGGGETWIYGADVKLKWKPANNDRGWPFVLWQTEFIGRDYGADAGIHPGPDAAAGTGDDVFLNSDTLHDWGLYTQLLYGFTPGWSAGVRYEYATGSGDGVDGSGLFVSHNDDPFRDDRHRVSPLLVWQPTHFSRFRLQYNYDHAAHLNHDAHSVWFGVEFLFGAHPAHGY